MPSLRAHASPCAAREAECDPPAPAERILVEDRHHDQSPLPHPPRYRRRRPLPRCLPRHARRLRALGVRTVFVTPHLTGPLDDAYLRRVDAACREVAPRAAAAGIALERGFEIRLGPETPAQLRAGAPITLAGTRVALIDLPFTAWPHYADETLFSVQTSGLIPVLAHPERYPGVQRDPDIALRLVDRGILLQVTAGSFSGIFGRAAKRSAETLLAAGLVHLVATDAHSAGHRKAAVPSGLKRLRDLVGDAGLRRLTVEAPAMLLNGDPITPIAPAPQPGGLRRLFAAVGH